MSDRCPKCGWKIGKRAGLECFRPGSPGCKDRALARKDRVIRVLLAPPPLCGDACRAWRERLCTKTDIARWDSDDCRGRRLRAAEAEADKENYND